MAINVLITINDIGEHHVHVNGSHSEVHQLVEVSCGLLTEMPQPMAWCREEKWRELRVCWHTSKDALAHDALSLLDHNARPDHLRQHPDCPYQ